MTIITIGKLSTSSSKDKQGNDVKDYYENDRFQKKEIVTSVNGELRISTYDKSGKLISLLTLSIRRQVQSMLTLLIKPKYPTNNIIPGS